jgi:hypothetical protein
MPLVERILFHWLVIREGKDLKASWKLLAWIPIEFRPEDKQPQAVSSHRSCATSRNGYNTCVQRRVALAPKTSTLKPPTALFFTKLSPNFYLLLVGWD